MIDRDGAFCVWCSRELTLQNATLEHAVPCSDGGSHRIENLLAACSACNNTRRSTPFLKWLKLCQERGLVVRDDVIRATIDRMSRKPERMRKQLVLQPLPASPQRYSL